MSIIIKQLSYLHSNRELLFNHISLSLAPGEKAALIGNNGSGKSTLLQLLTGNCSAAEGEIICSEKPYLIPQHLGQYNRMNIAEALNINGKIDALHKIIGGDASVENFNLLNEDWTIEERAREALDFWKLEHLDLSTNLSSLSGGEKTKVFLAGIAIHAPEIILMDEPSNHLDYSSRKQLYDFIANSRASMLIVSHDRSLLNLLDTTLELLPDGIREYGGNYEFYKEEKAKENNALLNKIQEKEKALKMAKKTAREAMERQMKHNVRGEKQSAKKGIPRIAMGGLKDHAEKSTSRLKGIHADKTQAIAEDLGKVRSQLSIAKDMKLNFENANLHSGKILVDAKKINFQYPGRPSLWKEALDFQIRSGERIAITGANGSGKTTLIGLITDKLQATEGRIVRADFESVYIDQEYSLLNNQYTIYRQVEEFNSKKLLEHELKTLLNRFLFPKESWEKKVDQLSGGEKMRLLLCCLQIQNKAPDLFILDEPTNNLDIQSLEILTSTLQTYQGSLLLISHDHYFSSEVGIGKSIDLS